MQRSRLRKIKQSGADQRQSAARILLRRAPIAAAIMAAVPRLYAADTTEDTTALQEVIVTAEKRTENLQSVPISITTLGTEQLQQLNVQGFDDYVKYLPSVAYQTTGAGFSRVFMRGVASGDNGNHSGPLPSVGVYLDEQPVTTIQGSLDIHMYDIERVEALAGPQGTLYGASSEAGTVRIITNKPDPSGFKAGYSLEANTVRGQGGYVAEGFVNIPLSSSAAVRLVGWAEHAGGYIDNVPGTNVFPTFGCVSNFAPPPATCPVAGINVSSPEHAKNRFNPTDTYGGRGALKINLGDNWTITPSFMGQSSRQDGTAFVDPAIPGDLSIQRYYPDYISDQWWQAALTVEGHISNFDITYAGGYLKRDDSTSADYTDYTLLYDKNTSYTSYLESVLHLPPGSKPVNLSQYILGSDEYRKLSQELRVATPKDSALRFIGGLFYNRQEHYIIQNYRIDALPELDSVTGWPQTWWLTNQIRVDRDYAVFGELSFDFTKNLTGTVGYRFYRYDNSLDGFFGYGLHQLYSNTLGGTGEKQNNPQASPPTCEVPGILGGPCIDLARDVTGSGSTPKFNLTYKFNADAMIYATYSKGFRPGGVNRRTQGPPNPPLSTYAPDFLTNYELGFKTSWLNNHLRFNGAFFWEDWKDFQYSFLGQNSFTIIRNAGAARIKGAEQELDWAAAPGLSIHLAATELDAKLTEPFCYDVDYNTGQPLPPATCPAYDSVPNGTQLPVVPKFKGDARVRYTFPLGSNDLQGYGQAAYSYTGEATSALAPYQNALIGNVPAYGLLDLMLGLNKGNFNVELFASNALDNRAQTTRFAECTVVGSLGSPLIAGTTVCGAKPLATIAVPLTLGLRFSQSF
jgi:outer membrane receptor protein involved in Fe transport